MCCRPPASSAWDWPCATAAAAAATEGQRDDAMSSAFTLGQRRAPFRPPEAPGLGRGFAFAIIAHAALLAALSAGVQWRTETPPAFEAELWSAVPQAAAPREEAPPPEPEPEVKPAPKPPPPVEDLQAEREAEIAIAKAREQKKRELEAKRLAELEAERKKLKEQKELKELKDKQERDKKLVEDKKLQQQEKAKQDKAL